MFTEKQNLIVVYKDEVALNFLKKLVETKDDNDGDSSVGTKDDSVNIVAWDEDVWLEHKKAGTVKDKVLFIGNVKGIDKLSPVVDFRYEKWGVKYGWAGKQAMISVSIKELSKKENYMAFKNEYDEGALPEKKKSTRDYNSKLEAIKYAAIGVGFGLIGLGSTFIIDFIRYQKTIKRQLLCYGIYELYINHLQEFLDA